MSMPDVGELGEKRPEEFELASSPSPSDISGETLLECKGDENLELLGEVVDLERAKSFRKLDLTGRTVSCFINTTLMFFAYIAACTGLSLKTRLRENGIFSPDPNDCGAGREN